jgi:hypothetical protein
MKIRMHHTEIGDGYLTTEHSSSSYDQPVFVDDFGNVYGPGDNFPRSNCNVGYLHKADGVEYTPEDIQWVHDYIVRTHLKGCVQFEVGMGGKWLIWCFGATWKTLAQLEEIQSRNGVRMVLNV